MKHTITMETHLQLVNDTNQHSSHIDEYALINRTKAGDKAAFKALYDMHLPKVFGLCSRLCADKSQAEDATQEVFIQLWQKIHSYKGDSQFSTWLHRVTTNITISYIRKQKSWWQRMMNIDDSAYQEQGAEDSAASLDLETLIKKLPERARLVFVLHAIEGYRHEQVAETLNMAVGTSKTQFHRARKMLEEWVHE